ncbi:SRPBCC family protein [Mucilaginibacter sp. BT774]|uniref:SRPBCC family protein n=1 Tax=Mucilaginibacter sp. BT774 TaxID=3062276 RepID=UPI002675CDBA|nr:SRPBCC family protein [Mucilaginibacter sp. BT774]MDO3627626.1 SRPBCC family protein [Mucilaginibacter sp. BT774]
MNTNHFAKAEMLIRKPIGQVFQAFIDPGITTKFWFTKSSGKLEEGKRTEWTWEMYHHTISVLTKKIEVNKKIVIEWGNDDTVTTVAWTFKDLGHDETFVSIEDGGFQGDTEKLISQVRGSTEGFTLVLAGLKAYLEHHIELNLIADRFPKGLNK